MERVRIGVEQDRARDHGAVVALDTGHELGEHLLERRGAGDQLVDASVRREQVLSARELALGGLGGGGHRLENRPAGAGLYASG
jgi:hypothetical protein